MATLATRGICRREESLRKINHRIKKGALLADSIYLNPTNAGSVPSHGISVSNNVFYRQADTIAGVYTGAHVFDSSVHDNALDGIKGLIFRAPGADCRSYKRHRRDSRAAGHAGCTRCHALHRVRRSSLRAARRERGQRGADQDRLSPVVSHGFVIGVRLASRTPAARRFLMTQKTRF